MPAVTFEKWDPKAVEEMVKADLERNSELVGMFVETDARKRLDAISSPSNLKAVRWRAFLSKWCLTHVVKVEPKAVETLVGMRTSTKKGGTTRGYYVEVGSRSAPAHPYLRPALFNNKATILKLLTGK